MKSSVLLLFLLVAGSAVLAQKSEFITDHAHHLKSLGNAKDSVYEQILHQFNKHVRLLPKDFQAQLERCRFIQNAYYDSYEDYNPKAEEAEACARDLIDNFPEEPQILLYGTEFLYGDTAIAYLEKLAGYIDDDPEAWLNHNWEVYKQLAEQHNYNDNFKEVIRYAERAIEVNDTLDLSLMLGGAYKSLSRNTEAIDVLIKHLESSDEAWELNQKGRLLLELEVPDKALNAFKLATRDSSGYEDMGGLAQAMIDNGLAKEAREYLLKDYKRSTWNNSKPLQQLLEYDLTYSAADSAEFTYTRFAEAGFWNDPFGIYRLRLLFKSPLSGWTLADVGRIVLLLLLFVAIFILPYLWILPIHYLGVYQKAKGKVFPESSFRWGLRHFWLACSLWLASDVLGSLIFDYPGIIALVNDNLTPENVQAVSKVNANLLLSFSTGCLLFSVALLKTEDIVQFLSQLNGSLRNIGTGVGLAFLLRFGLGIYLQILKAMGVNLTSDPSTIASVTDSVVSVNKFYNPFLGFLFVVLFVPFYEEVLFRGVFLSACQRNMKFIFANALQALVFALAHQELKLIPFYFAFGMVAGHFRQKSESLIIGTSMHITNNLVAFVVILSLRS